MSTKAIVTGHARGLGEAVAAGLLARNIPVLGLSRHRNVRLGQGYQGLLSETPIDLADSAQVCTWLAGSSLSDWLTGADSVALVNNAGMLQPIGPLGMQGASSIAAAVALNVAAPLMLANAVVNASGVTTERRILHVSSGAARNAYAGWSVYCATKAALDRHAQSVALDQIQGLRICSLAPGVIDTEMQAEIRATSDRLFPKREQFESLKRSGGLVSPRDCAEQLVAHLLSDRFGLEPVADLRDFNR